MPLHHWEHVMQANRGEIPMAKLLLEGKKILFHHWKEGASASSELQQAWKEADVIVCCDAAHLPWYANAKSLCPRHKGVLLTHPFLNTRTNMVHVKF